ncbi:MAG: WD40/YVTN/BNR-like repeat-containing protein, partial [Pyrinomonadaceae bacterium]
GKTWKLRFKNDDPKAFYDAMACRGQQCFAVSDPVDGWFPITGTHDGFSTWKTDYGWAVLPAVAGEAAFAASGTCLIFAGGRYWFVTGGIRTSVYNFELHEDDELHSKRVDSPIPGGGAASGIFSVAMFDSKKGVIVGGNYEKPDEHEKNLALTTDGGATWKLGTGLSGYRSGVTYVDRKTIIAVGTNGSDITRDGGKTWTVLGKENLNAVASKGRRATWAVGPKGIVVKLKSGKE